MTSVNPMTPASEGPLPRLAPTSCPGPAVARTCRGLRGVSGGRGGIPGVRVRRVWGLLGSPLLDSRLVWFPDRGSVRLRWGCEGGSHLGGGFHLARRGGERGLVAKTMGFAVACSQFLPPRFLGRSPMALSRETMRGFPAAEITSPFALDLVAREPSALKGRRMRSIPSGRPTASSSKGENGRVRRRKKKRAGNSDTRGQRCVSETAVPTTTERDRPHPRSNPPGSLHNEAFHIL